jgi:hypothetical protein
MKKLTIRPKIRKWIIIVHRDLGFLMVGLSLVYGISGILLNHLKGNNFDYKIDKRTETIAANLSSQELQTVWQYDKHKPKLNSVGEGKEIYRLMIDSGIGYYDIQTGALNYETSKKRPIAYWINRLHYNRVKGWMPIGDLYATSLIFLALSGLFMIKGKNGIAGRGKWYLIIGLILPIIYIFLG